MNKMNKFYAAVLVAALPGLTGCETFGGVYNVPEPVIAAGDRMADPAEETALPTDAASEEELRQKALEGDRRPAARGGAYGLTSDFSKCALKRDYLPDAV